MIIPLYNKSIILTLLMQYLSKQDVRLLDKFSFPIGCMLLQHLFYKEKKTQIVQMYIAVAEHKINNQNIIQIKVSSFHFIVVILKTCLLETIAKKRPSPVENLVMKCICHAVAYISLLLQTFPLKLSHFLFKDNRRTILYFTCIYGIALYIIYIATYLF